MKIVFNKTLYQSHNNDFIPVSNLQIFRGFLEKCFCFNCVRGTRTQPLIGVGCSVYYWLSCTIYKGGFFEIACSSSSTHICLALKTCLQWVRCPNIYQEYHSYLKVTNAKICHSVFRYDPTSSRLY